MALVLEYEHFISCFVKIGADIVSLLVLSKAALSDCDVSFLDSVVARGYLSRMEQQPFWKTKSLEELSPAEWESLCDGCGQCCLHKLEDEDTGEIYLTSIACTLLDSDSCQCSDYCHRRKTVPDCVFLTPELVRSVPWLPKTCAYRLVADGEDLYWWHPLLSGNRDSVHEAGISVRGQIAVFDHQLESEEEYVHYLTGTL